MSSDKSDETKTVPDDASSSYTYGPNPDLYRQLAVPKASREEAEEVTMRFLNAVANLRKQYGIPEVLVLAGSHCKQGDEPTSVIMRACAFGDPSFSAQLGAVAFNRYTLPELERADALRAMASEPTPKVSKKGKKR